MRDLIARKTLRCGPSLACTPRGKGFPSTYSLYFDCWRMKARMSTICFSLRSTSESGPGGVACPCAGAQEIDDLLVPEGDGRVVGTARDPARRPATGAMAALAALQEGDPAGVRVAGGRQIHRTTRGARTRQCGLGGFACGLLGLRGGCLLGDLLSGERRRRRYVQRVVDVLFRGAPAGDGHDGNHATHRKEREPGPDLCHTAHLCLV